MIKLTELLEASSAAEEAKKKGWVSSGWGRWQDPKTGKIVARTVKGKLVPVTDKTDIIDKTRSTRGIGIPAHPKHPTQKQWGASKGAEKRRKNASIWPDKSGLGKPLIGSKNMMGDVMYFEPNQEDIAKHFATSYSNPRDYRAAMDKNNLPQG